MNLKDIDSAISKIGCLTITSIDGNTMHSRIISICGCDDEAIYFLTMDVKPFYRQLKSNPHIALCGIYPSGRKEGKNKDGQPYWPPGFFLRITGDAQEVSGQKLAEKAAAGSEIHRYALEEAARYPAMKLFGIFRGKGEVFDYDFELETRDHKLLRQRFAFGGETVNQAGVQIAPDKCLACGECYDVCTFSAIEEGDGVYVVRSERCDECGSCINSCPAEAISPPQVL